MSETATGPLFVAEFDNYPSCVGTVELRPTQLGYDLVICTTETEETLISTDRDQWGVFVSSENSCVAQEDGTRSFLLALSSAISALRSRSEINTTEPTITA